MQKCPPGSLAKYELPDLIEVSTVDEQCLAEARKEFAKKYSNEFVTFNIAGPMFYDADELTDLQKEQMTSFTESLTFVRNFGDLMIGLALNFEDLDFLQAKEFVTLVNEKCSGTVKKLILRNCYGNLLTELKNQFKAVHVLEFSSNGTEALKPLPKAQKFDVIFPNITVLAANNMKASDWAFLHGKFAELKLLKVNNSPLSSKKESDACERELVKFVRVNRNLLNIHLEAANLKLLNDISKYLPKLGRLSLEGLSENYFNYDGNAIKFENMQVFSFVMNAENEIPENIDLQKIQGLELVLGDKYDKKWSEFVKKQVNKKLHTLLLNVGKLSNKTLLSIYEQFPELVSTVIQTASYFDAQDIENVLSKGRELMQLQWVIRIKQSELKKLKKSLEDKWSLKCDPIPQLEGLMRIAMIKFVFSNILKLKNFD